MFNRILLFISMGIVVLSSCTKPSITFTSDNNLLFDSSKSFNSVSFTSTRDWTAISTDSWITVSPTSGSGGNILLNVAVQENDPNNGIRKGYITIESGGISEVITVEQQQKNAINVYEEHNIDPSGGNLVIGIDHNVELSVLVEDSAKDWISFVGTKAMTSDNYVFTIEPNNSSNSRSATVSVIGGGISKDIKINQEGHYIEVNTTPITYNPEGSSKTVLIRSSCSWMIYSDQEWIHISVLTGSSGNTSVIITTDESEDISIRHGSVIIDNADYNIKKTIEISQNTYAWYVDEKGINWGKGITIDGKIWAPVNCGYDPDNAPGGLYYQWGRKNGQGRNPQIADIWKGKNGEEDKNTVYYYAIHDLNSGAKYDGDWIINGDNSFWNIGTELSPKKNNEYDPCPQGWRVPTGSELSSLIKNWFYRAGEGGMWYSGSTPYSDSSQNRIFLPGAGQMCLNWSWQYNGDGAMGVYWSSSHEESISYLYFHATTLGGTFYVPYRRSGLTIRCIHE